MALDAMTDALVKETFSMLEAAPVENLDKPIRISPRRMRALILFSQQRINAQIRSTVVTMVEDSNAPETFAEALEEAQPTPEPAAKDNVSTDEVTPEELVLLREMRAARARTAQGPRNVAELYAAKGPNDAA